MHRYFSIKQEQLSASIARFGLLVFALVFMTISSFAQDAPTVDIGGNDELGSFLVASNGLTLYTFANDQPGVSNCSDSCLESWPAYTVEAGAELTAAAGVEGTLGTITRNDGSTQVTLDDKPLYFFITDTAPGDANGQGAGGVWFVVGVDAPAEETAEEQTTEPEAAAESVAVDAAAGETDLVSVSSSPELGVYLVASNGMTLYTFTNDTEGVSNCVAQCLELWPAFLTEQVDGFPIFVESLGGVLDVIEREEGLQLTFNGDPLYFYIEDVEPGDTNGQGVGSVWFVANVDMLHASATEQLGNILVAGDGFTLYTFANDEEGVSNCVAQCAELWPPLTVASADALPAVDESAVSGEFGTITRDDGSFQVTLDGQPLYTYSEDLQPGDINGQGVGSVWFAVGLDTVRIAENATLGSILTNGAGLSLYTFANDEPGWSNCVGDCVSTWPALTVADPESILAPAGLQSALSTTERADGSFQVTFNNQPLYIYVGDQAPGDVNGNGIGDVWFAAGVERVAAVGGNAELGAFVVADDGMTLYTFANDTEGASNCQGDCAVTWPPLTVEAGSFPVAGAGITQELGVIDRGDGTLQVTLDGRPVYYFSNDAVPGDANGQGAGGVWFVFELPNVEFDAASVPVSCVLEPTLNGVNLRTGPSTSFEAVGQASVGQSLTAVGQSNSEGYIWFLLDNDAFVRSDVVNAEPACANLPFVEE